MNNNNTTSCFKKLKSQKGTKSHKQIYHFAWFFALIMKLCLDFTEELCAEIKVNNNFEFQKLKTQKKVN